MPIVIFFRGANCFRSNHKEVSHIKVDSIWFPKNFIHVVYDGVDFPSDLRKTDLHSEFDLIPKSKVVIGAGRLVEQKRFDLLIDVAHRAKKDNQPAGRADQPADKRKDAGRPPQVENPAVDGAEDGRRDAGQKAGGRAEIGAKSSGVLSERVVFHHHRLHRRLELGRPGFIEPQRNRAKNGSCADPASKGHHAVRRFRSSL